MTVLTPVRLGRRSPGLRERATGRDSPLRRLDWVLALAVAALIGLGSLLARFDAMGGAMDINSQIGYGTQVMRRRRRSRSPLPASRAHTQVGEHKLARFAAWVCDSASARGYLAVKPREMTSR